MLNFMRFILALIRKEEEEECDPSAQIDVKY